MGPHFVGTIYSTTTVNGLIELFQISENSGEVIFAIRIKKYEY